MPSRSAAAGGATGAQLAAAVLTGVPGESGYVVASLLFAALALLSVAVAATIHLTPVAGRPPSRKEVA